MASDGVPTNHWFKRIFTKDNAKQLSTIGGGAVASAGSVLMTAPSIYAQAVGLLMVLFGGSAIGANSGPVDQPKPQTSYR